MNNELTIAFIGGGNMASALASGLIGKRCGAHDVHVLDIDAAVLGSWRQKGTSVATAPDDRLSACRVWILAVKPQFLKEAVKNCQPFLQADTLVISVAAGIPAGTLSEWLGTGTHPWTRLIRGMPNTPALVGSGATGLMAMDGATDQDKTIAQQIFAAVGTYVWVNNDRELDIVTALSGSGPAYVFLFLEALIEGAVSQGLSPEQARTLAIATLDGANQLAALSPQPLAALREQVTSKGGTTAAALQVFQERGFTDIVHQAMLAAARRAEALAQEFSQ